MKFAHILLVVLATVFAVGCERQEAAVQERAASSTSLSPHLVVGNFLAALKNKDKSGLVASVRDTGVFVVRDSSSGNDVAGGEDLYQVFNAKNITDELELPVANQVPVNFAGLFLEAADQDFAHIATYTADLPALLPNRESAKLWLQKLKDDLQSRFEGKQGIPVLLVSPEHKLVVLCEAQIIDNTLVGNVAVFSENAEHRGLGSVIDLL